MRPGVRFNDTGRPGTIRGVVADTALDLGVIGDRLVLQGVLDLAHRGEGHALARLILVHQRHVDRAPRTMSCDGTMIG